MPGEFLRDFEWRYLLSDIHERQVIPVVGPELVTIADPASGSQVPLVRALAPRLAERLNLPPGGEALATINRVACEHLLHRGQRRMIYREVAELLDGLDAASVPPALADLASITDFDLYVSSTIDPLLAMALEKARPGFRRADHVKAYDYKRPEDLPESLRPALVFHLLGNRKTYPNFAVWEEDYLEFIFGLVSHHAQLERLFRLLKSRYLLLLGAPFTDWIVRFFLFVAKGGRFTDRQRDEVQAYLTDHPENLGEPLIFFFDRVVGTTKIISGDAAEFTSELAGRWRAKYQGAVADEDILAQVPDEMPKDAVFLSYSHDDVEAMMRMLRGLRAAGVPVWIDKQRIHAGQNYERSLEHAVKSSSFFVSMISKATESDPKRFVHQERRWAAEMHVDGFAYYLPVVIDDAIVRPSLEPERLVKVHFERLPNGEVSPAFASRLQNLVESFRKSGRPRE